MARLEAEPPFFSLARPLLAKGQGCTVSGTLGPVLRGPSLRRETWSCPQIITELPPRGGRHPQALVRWENTSAMSFSQRKPVSSSASQVLLPGAKPWRGIRSTCRGLAV